jgi:hypothetical protein
MAKPPLLCCMETDEISYDPRIPHRPIHLARGGQTPELLDFCAIVPQSEQWMWTLTACLMLFIVAIGIVVSLK